MRLDREKYKTYTFIADGMISTSDIGEGRLVPCIILEKNTSYEIAELCKVHEDSPPGDVETVWVRPISFTKPKELILKIKFNNPIELTFGVVFNIAKHYNLIDGIIQSKMLKIEAGDLGDKVSDLKNSSIMIEVQRKSMNNNWQSYLEDSLKKKYRDKGVPKGQIKQLVQQHIKAMREIWNLRQR